MKAMIEFSRIDELPETRILGNHHTMSFGNDTTFQLWRSFGPVIKEIKGRIGEKLYSIEIYPPDFFEDFSPSGAFEKWAGVPVSRDVEVPHPLKLLVIPRGEYAVFSYQGTPSDAPPAYQWIFREWLPSSGRVLDHRPHLAIMGREYRQNDPSSREEIWIPIRTEQGDDDVTLSSKAITESSC